MPYYQRNLRRFVIARNATAFRGERNSRSERNFKRNSSKNTKKHWEKRFDPSERHFNVEFRSWATALKEMFWVVLLLKTLKFRKAQFKHFTKQKQSFKNSFDKSYPRKKLNPLSRICSFGLNCLFRFYALFLWNCGKSVLSLREFGLPRRFCPFAMT